MYFIPKYNIILTCSLSDWIVCSQLHGSCSLRCSIFSIRFWTCKTSFLLFSHSDFKLSNKLLTPCRFVSISLTFALHSCTFFSKTKLQRALVGLFKNEIGKRLLPLVDVDNGFEVAKDKDWQDIKAIDVDSLNNVQNYRQESTGATTGPAQPWQAQFIFLAPACSTYMTLWQAWMRLSS